VLLVDDIADSQARDSCSAFIWNRTICFNSHHLYVYKKNR